LEKGEQITDTVSNDISEPNRKEILAARFHTALSSSLKKQTCTEPERAPLKQKSAKRGEVKEEILQSKVSVLKASKTTANGVFGKDAISDDSCNLPPSSTELADLLYNDSMVPNTSMHHYQNHLDKDVVLDEEDKLISMDEVLLKQYRSHKKEIPKTPSIKELATSNMSKVKNVLPYVLKSKTLFQKLQKDLLREKAITEDGLLSMENHATDLQCFVEVSIAAGTKHVSYEVVILRAQ